MNIEDNTGWVKIYRKTLESTVFQNIYIWQVWTWCIMKANHKDNKFMFNGKDITVSRGSFITGREKALSEMPEISARRYRTAINYLKSTNRITTQATNKYTIITVCKYDEYQNNNSANDQQEKEHSDQPATNQRPTNDHKQECKELKNEKNIGVSGEKIFNLFKEVFPEQVMGETETQAALRLSDKLKQTEIKAEDALRSFFIDCKNISEPYTRRKITLPYIADKLNEVRNAIAADKKKPASGGGKSRSGGGARNGKYRKEDCWSASDRGLKPGTSPDLEKVDKTNYLNEQ